MWDTVVTGHTITNGIVDTPFNRSFYKETNAVAYQGTAATGIGKSTLTILNALSGLVASKRQRQYVFAVPDHELAKQLEAEIYAAAERMGIIPPTARIWKAPGTILNRGEPETACGNLELYQSVAAELGNPVKRVCANCSLKDTCVIMLQRGTKPDFLIVTQKALTTGLRNSGDEVTTSLKTNATLIVDEQLCEATMTASTDRGHLVRLDEIEMFISLLQQPDAPKCDGDSEEWTNLQAAKAKLNGESFAALRNLADVCRQMVIEVPTAHHQFIPFWRLIDADIEGLNVATIAGPGAKLNALYSPDSGKIPPLRKQSLNNINKIIQTMHDFAKRKDFTRKSAAWLEVRHYDGSTWVGSFKRAKIHRDFSRIGKKDGARHRGIFTQSGTPLPTSLTSVILDLPTVQAYLEPSPPLSDFTRIIAVMNAPIQHGSNSNNDNSGASGIRSERNCLRLEAVLHHLAAAYGFEDERLDLITSKAFREWYADRNANRNVRHTHMNGNIGSNAHADAKVLISHEYYNPPKYAQEEFFRRLLGFAPEDVRMNEEAAWPAAVKDYMTATVIAQSGANGRGRGRNRTAETPLTQIMFFHKEPTLANSYHEVVDFETLMAFGMPYLRGAIFQSAAMTATIYDDVFDSTNAVELAIKEERLPRPERPQGWGDGMCRPAGTTNMAKQFYYRPDVRTELETTFAAKGIDAYFAPIN